MGHGEHDGDDPHRWLDPLEGRRMATAVRDVLRAVDAANADVYDAGWRALVERIDAADAANKKRLAAFRGREFYVYHPALGHFGARYGLQQIALEHEEKEPSARQLARWIDRAKQHGVRVLFVQPQFPKRTAMTVARSLGAELVEVDPLARDYAANLERLGEAVAAAFAKDGGA
ncbi:MAG: zinc ABC transporter substrate-binding protein [Deltaproteobacteria bacterium]|nr:zinc ABC transporter substrate-binding protein [Deltaproteobacteria bacterium]